MPKSTPGVDIMQKIHSGEMKKLPMEHVSSVRLAVADNLSELLDFGARIRPLLLEGKRIGWIRGIHLSERKVIQRWSMDLPEFAENLIRYGTTLSQEFIESLNSTEMQGLVRLIKEASDYDLSLFPYLYAFSTTSFSYRLWCSRGQAVSSFENRCVPLPDGKEMKILVPSDHARFWAQMCVQWEQAVERNEANLNAALIIKPWVGKGADGLTNALRNTAKQLQLDNNEHWENVVSTEKQIDVADGWAHAADSVEGLQRELKGMMENDRHERLIEAFEKQQQDEVDKTKKAANKRVEARGGPGIVSEKVEILTEKEVKEREKKLRRGRTVPTIASRDDREVTQTPQERIKKYK